jgi:ATP-dependent DNA helicase RecG
MVDSQLESLFHTLRAQSGESEWVEFKEANTNPEEIGEYISALSNSAALLRKEAGYLLTAIIASSVRRLTLLRQNIRIKT